MLSAHADDLLRADARAIAGYLDRFPESTVTQVARQLHTTRRVRGHRAVLRAANRPELVDGLRALAAGREHPRSSPRHRPGPRGTAFVFPGQGRHWPGMGAAAYRALPAYRAAADRCAAAFTAAGIASPLRYLTADDEARLPSPRSRSRARSSPRGGAGRGLARLRCAARPHRRPEPRRGRRRLRRREHHAARRRRRGRRARSRGGGRLPGCYAMATLGVGAPAAGRSIAGTDGWAELSVVYSDFECRGFRRARARSWRSPARSGPPGSSRAKSPWGSR